MAARSQPVPPHIAALATKSPARGGALVARVNRLLIGLRLAGDAVETCASGSVRYSCCSVVLLFRFQPYISAISRSFATDGGRGYERMDPGDFLTEIGALGGGAARPRGASKSKKEEGQGEARQGPEGEAPRPR